MEELNTTLYYPIGTVGRINGIHVKVMPANGTICTNCVYDPGCSIPRNCVKEVRKDRINIIYEIQM